MEAGKTNMGFGERFSTLGGDTVVKDNKLC